MSYNKIDVCGLAVRRTSKRVWFIVLGIFVAVFLFSFMALRFRMNEDADAASMANFDPGYIISDWQMSNYNSMSESDIQAFLESKNSCNDTNIGKYTVGEKVGYFSEISPPRTWHVENGHFVCMADEVFNGGTAAHIIYRAAQDYRINPQVLLVLLEKEQSLVTDTFPHSQQYRSATGYGCPDTAPCSSQYYGLQNQIRKAAELYRTVLDGGWTNYPLGYNYVQYNPNPDCGGTVINIRSLATSALYRYTPYQPNSAVLNGWNDGCGAYGNMNFYKLFQDWFGGITESGGLTGRYENMVLPRLLYVKKDAKYISPQTGEIKKREFDSFEFFTHLNHYDSKLCLSIGSGRNCYYYSDLEELSFSDYEDMMVPRLLAVKDGARAINFQNSSFDDESMDQKKQIFTKKIFINGKLCLQRQDNTTGCVLYDDLNELSVVKFQDMVVPRYFGVKEGAEKINMLTGLSEPFNEDKKVFLDISTHLFGELCLGSNNIEGESCILYSDLVELSDDGFEKMVKPRYLKVLKGAKIYDTELQKENGTYNEDTVLFFDKKTQFDGALCLSAYAGICVKYDNLIEIGSFVRMDIPRYISIQNNSHYYTWGQDSLEDSISKGQRFYFTEKTTVDGRLCLRTDDDVEKKKYRCIMYDNLGE